MGRGNLSGHGGARSVRLPEARTTPGRADRPEVAGFHMENERASVGRHLAQRRRRRPTALLAAACILLVLALGIGSVEAAGALASGWDESSQGPRPDVWVPASSAWALQVALRQQAAGQAVL